MPKKLSYEYVKEYIEKEGYTLLTNEYKGDITKLELICPNGHEWSITWKNFKKGSRCPFCTGKKSTHKRTHKEAKKEIEKEGYKLLSEYKNANSKILIQCPHGHTYEVEFNSFHKGRRCKLCTNKNIKFTYEEVKEYIESQGDKLLSKEYKNNKNKLEIQCCEGHIYERRYDKYRQGQRCPICNSSGGEQILYNILKKLNIEFEREKRFKDCKDVNTLPFDTYIESLNLIIEFDGEQHFKPKFGEKEFYEIVYHDAIKNSYCEDNNINLLRIPFWNIDFMEEIVKNKIDELIKTFDGQVS